MSAATAGRMWMRATFPSGTIDEQQRVSTGMAYSGNALTPAGGRMLFRHPGMTGRMQDLLGGLKA